MTTPEPEPPEAVSEETEAETETEAGEVFENRAARRARGKGRQAAPPAGKGHLNAGRGAVQGPRQWGNRRSG